MTFVDRDMTITTWGAVDGNQRWRVRTANGTKVAEFFADRDTDVGVLFELAEQRLAEVRE